MTDSHKTKPILIAMMGLPRSGKSTWVAKWSKITGAPIVRRDAIRLALHGERWLEEAEPMVKAMSLYMIRSLFIAGHPLVICDETNYSKEAREALKSKDWDIVWHVEDTHPDICKQRAVATGQADLIPVIDEMWARYTPLSGDDVKVVDIPSMNSLVCRNGVVFDGGTGKADSDR